MPLTLVACNRISSLISRMARQLAAEVSVVKKIALAGAENHHPPFLLRLPHGPRADCNPRILRYYAAALLTRAYVAQALVLLQAPALDHRGEHAHVVGGARSHAGAANPPLTNIADPQDGTATLTPRSG